MGDRMSTLKADTIQSTGGGAATLTKQSAAKVWLNLNGTGTIAIRDSFNVSGVSDGGTGNYTTSFTTSFSNANYSHSHTNIPNDNSAGLTINSSFAQATGSILQRNAYWSGVESANSSSGDSLHFYIQEHGDLA